MGQIATGDYGTTIITFEEQMRGRLAQIAAAGWTASQNIAFYVLLNGTFRFYCQIAVWQYTEAAARLVEGLRETGVRIGTQDLKIASITLSFWYNAADAQRQ